MADAPTNNKISFSTPFGPIAATGTAAIVGLLIVIVLGYLYFEMDKIGDRFAVQTAHLDARFKQMEDIQAYNACIARLAVWQAQRPRGEAIDFNTMPSEFFYCLPKWLSK
jgi:hypothetical protein